MNIFEHWDAFIGNRGVRLIDIPEELLEPCRLFFLNVNCGTCKYLDKSDKHLPDNCILLVNPQESIDHPLAAVYDDDSVVFILKPDSFFCAMWEEKA